MAGITHQDAELLFEQYMQRGSDDLRSTVTLKEPSGAVAPNWVSEMTVYTDGACKGATQAIDDRGFSGWGLAIHAHNPNGDHIGLTRFGGMFNATTIEAEMAAIYNAVKAIIYPSNVVLVTDCAAAIHLLSNREKVRDMRRELDETLPKDRSSAQWQSAKTLKWVEDTLGTIRGNRNILDMSIRWTPSHMLTTQQAAGGMIDVKTRRLKSFAGDLLGNHSADLMANEGVGRAIQGALREFRMRTPDIDPLRQFKVCHKNFRKSRFCRDHAVSYLKDRPNFFVREDVEGLLGVRTANEVFAGWKAAADKNTMIWTPKPFPVGCYAEQKAVIEDVSVNARREAGAFSM